MDKITNHFLEQDPILYKQFIRLVNKIKKIEKDKSDNYFHRLCRDIVYQQLSGKAGSTIFNRFTMLFPGEIVQPSDILLVTHEQLRAVGLSNAKASYIRNLAKSILSNEVKINDLDLMADDEVVKELVKVKGIGPWTAEMFLIFTLGRENVFSLGDLGLKKGMMKIYSLTEEPTKRQMEEITSRWSPYKTYGSLLMWAALDE